MGWIRCHSDGKWRARSTCFALLWLSLAASGCAIDPEAACGPHQLRTKNDFDGQSSTVCVCDEEAGYVFDVRKGYGCARCEGDKEIRNGACVAMASGDGGMEGTSKGPTGIGVPCTSNTDCAAFDAQLCDVVMTHACVLDRCHNGQNVCPMDQSCCDLSHLLADLSVCVDDAIVDTEGCPMGGMLVEP